MLSDIQQRVARIFANLPEAESFALAGGAELIVRGEVDRLTRDLDFFGRSADDVDRVVPVFEAALAAAGMSFDRRQSAPGFTRLVVSDGAERTEVDVAADARLLPVESSPLGPVLSAEELAVDKVRRSLVEPNPAISSTSQRSNLGSVSSTSAGWRQKGSWILAGRHARHARPLRSSATRRIRCGRNRVRRSSRKCESLAQQTGHPWSQGWSGTTDARRAAVGPADAHTDRSGGWMRAVIGAVRACRLQSSVLAIGAVPGQRAPSRAGGRRSSI